MNLETVARFESLVDRLLEKHRQMEEERDLLVEERNHFRSELDRILAKIDRLEREAS